MRRSSPRVEAGARRSTAQGRYAAALGQARTLADKPADAMPWRGPSGRGEIDPARVEAWKLIVDLNWGLEERRRSHRPLRRGGRAFPAVSS